ncbi:MAG: virulence factor [Pseudomonadota bacterium]
MPQLVIVSWRDIPAQVIVGKGRKAAKRPLTERFEQAIDRCAMKVGARDDDAYLAEWRKSEPIEREGDPAEIADAEAARLEAEYDQARIKVLIENEGWADRPAA